MSAGHAGVLERAAAILNSFSPTRISLTLSELERYSGLPRSTVHRLAGQLEAVGLLQRNAEGYCIGESIFEWAQLVPHARLSRAALPYLQDVYGASKRIVHLAIRRGHWAFYIEKLQAHGEVFTPTRVGASLPLHSTGVGKIFLAFERGDLIGELENEGFPRFTEATLTSASALRREVSVIKRRGYALDDAENHPATRCVAAPVMGKGPDVVAAISLLLMNGDNPERFARLLQLAARGIARELAGA